MKRTTLLAGLLLSGRIIAQDQTPTKDTQAADGRPSSQVSGIETGKVIAPREIYSPEPKYRKHALKGHKKPVVEFRLVVGADGLPHDIELLRGVSPELDGAALDAVKNWKFARATKDGKPVAVKVNIEIHFTP